MRKIWNLTLNEWTKISRRTSILVILILMVVAVVGLGAILAATLDRSDRPYYEDPNWTKQSMADYLDSMEQRYAALEEEKKTAPADRLPGIEADMAALADEIGLYRDAVGYDINLMSNQNYLADLLREYRTMGAERSRLLAVPAADRTASERARLTEIDTFSPRMEAILLGHVFADYIALLDDRIRADATLTEEEKRLAIETDALWLRLDPDGSDAEGSTDKGVRQSLAQVQTLRRSLADNLDYLSYSGAVLPMTPERRSEVEDELAVLLYRLENGIPETGGTPADIAITAMTGVGQFMVVLLMCILAGSSVSNEISTGSIKSLIISPARRWKICTAKVLSLFTTGLLATLFLYGVAMIAHGVFFGFGSGSSYLYAHNGQAGETGFHLYQLARLGVQFIDVAVYMAMAFMLSVITRNTAVSVGLSIAVYFSGSIVRGFLTLFDGREWVRFIPFANLGLAPRVFPNDTAAQTAVSLFGQARLEHGPTLGFSLAYLAVLVFCMGYTAYDSFCRRDIK